MKEGLKVHRSVKTRLEASQDGSLYLPAVRPELPLGAGMEDGDESEDVWRYETRRLAYDEWNVDKSKHWEWVD